MCEELNDEMAEGRKAAEDLVDHMVRMGAGGLAIPVMRAMPGGEIVEFEVSVRVKGEPCAIPGLLPDADQQ